MDLSTMSLSWSKVSFQHPEHPVVRSPAQLNYTWCEQAACLLWCFPYSLCPCFLLIKSTEQSISVLRSPWDTSLLASSAPSPLFSRLESLSQLNCSQSVSQLALLIILVAFSWPFPSSAIPLLMWQNHTQYQRCRCTTDLGSCVMRLLCFVLYPFLNI